MKGSVLVTISPDCGSRPRKKKKLLRCPEQPLSHRAHRECGRWGRIRGRRTSITGTRGCNQPTHTEWHPQSRARNTNLRSYPNPLPAHSDPIRRVLVTTAAKIGYREPGAPSPPQSCHHHLPPLSPRGAPLIQSTLPPQVQPKQLGSEGRKERANNWFYSMHTHTYCHPKIPLPRPRQSFDMSFLTHNIPPVM